MKNILALTHCVMKNWTLSAIALAVMLTACGRLDHPPPPPEWLDTMKVQGQDLPVPKAWVQSEEGKIAHDLIPPAVVARMVAFDFTKARLQSLRPFSDDLSKRYWQHLCETEADEWIIKTVEGVEGFYFARPVPKPTWPEQLTDLYFLEAPMIDAVYYSRIDDDAKEKAYEQRGTFFVAWPSISYSYVEEPRRNTRWQQLIIEPYIRLFGYRENTHEKEWSLNEKGQKIQKGIPGTPMQLTGIAQLGISGSEYIIYDRTTKEVLSFRRTFLLAAANPQHTDRIGWLRGTHCPQAAVLPSGSERISYQPVRTLKTKEPSSAHPYKAKYIKKAARGVRVKLCVAQVTGCSVVGMVRTLSLTKSTQALVRLSGTKCLVSCASA